MILADDDEKICPADAICAVVEILRNFRTSEISMMNISEHFFLILEKIAGFYKNPCFLKFKAKKAFINDVHKK